MGNLVRRVWLKAWPKLIVATMGILVYLFAIRLSEDLKSLLVSVSATLISVPLIFILYDIWNEKSHRKLYEYAYKHAENTIYAAVDEVEDVIQLLMQGYLVYFRKGFVVVDDTDPEVVKVTLTPYAKHIIHAERDENYINPNYSKEDYIRDMDEICDNEEYKGGIYGFDKASIVPYISETEYLGFQVYGVDLSDTCERLNDLLKNTFIMDRIDEDQLIKFLYIINAINALHAFIDRTEDLFCTATNRIIDGFSVEEVDAIINNLGSTGVYSLTFNNAGITLELDKNVLFNVDNQELTSVFVINPDHYIEFGDHITEVLDCIEGSKSNVGTESMI